jgi:fumarate hydratase class II
LKKTMAIVNTSSGLPEHISNAIQSACDEVLSGEICTSQFPLSIWQTGSGTQTNMNINEVVANRANEILGDVRGGKTVHPNDHVNKGQSSNDSFPTAMHIAAVLTHHRKLIPSLEQFAESLEKKIQEFEGIIKIGRTHTQDATPITLSQEFSGYLSQIRQNMVRLGESVSHVLYLAQGGTAVGTGLNSFEGFDELFSQTLNKSVNSPSIQFKPAPNKFEALATNDALTAYHGSLAVLASSLHKIANDIRFLASGPRSGLGELLLPENEPGSSIMPGKVNPTQCEALTMLCGQVLGNNQAVLFGNANGHFELNVYRPLVIQNVIQSQNLIADGLDSFRTNCLDGIEANTKRIDELLNNSLMLVTALNPIIGYDNAAKIAKHAHKNELTLKQATLELGLLDEESFDKCVRAENMIAPSKK